MTTPASDITGTCHLCHGPTHGDPGAEGHGLGECCEVCPECEGSGIFAPEAYQGTPCPRCHGTGGVPRVEEVPVVLMDPLQTLVAMLDEQKTRAEKAEAALAELQVFIDELTAISNENAKVATEAQQALAAEVARREAVERERDEAREVARGLATSNAVTHQRDHACRECVPDSGILLAGFQCWRHKALAYPVTRPKEEGKGDG
jgi:hypothetical protein